MFVRSYRHVLAAVIGLALLAVGSVAHAQNLRVLPVPWVATDSTIPHQAYNGHATTFKAIARGGNGTYVVDWDFDGDGTYDNTRTTTNRYDLGVSFTYPNQTTTTTFTAHVRVTSNGQTIIGDYPVRVFADVPADPATATDRQLQVMRSVAVDDGLWFLHKQMTRSGNEDDPLTGAQATGNPNTNTTAGAAGFLWNLGLNGHLVAFPPAYIGSLPNAAENTQRWNQDPYAEDSMRLVNYLLTNASVVGIPTSDEVNNVGFYPETQATPIYGTDDGIGLYIGSSPGEQTVYYMGHALAALSVSHLTGFVAQVGDSNRVLGRRMEFVIQQLVDGLVWAQEDGTYAGSWYYTPNVDQDDMSTTLWGMTGLWHADEFMSSSGVIVPNFVKARLAQYIRQDSRTCPGAGFDATVGITGGSYRTAYAGVCDHTLSAGHVLALGWVGANQFDPTDARLAFPGYNSITRGQLRQQYNTTINFISGPQFTASSSTSISWNLGNVASGNFGRTDGLGDHYDMLHWQDAARAVNPPIVKFGNNDWSRLFSTYFIKNQAANGSWSWTYTSALMQNSDNSGGEVLRDAWAMLVLSPDAIPPLAIGQATPTTVPEGSPIFFDGTESDPGTGNPVYTWSFGNGATANGITATYSYPDNGVYNATLTSTSIGGTSVDTIPVTITNVAPTANAGADFTVAEGTAHTFDVAVTDPGTADTFTYAWDFGDGTTDSAQSPSHTYVDNGTYTVTVTVTDDDGGVGTDSLTVTVTNVAPTITSTPPTTASEGVAYSYLVTYTDPGSADTATCALTTSPAGMTMDPATCQIDWTPSFNQALGASADVTACVTDDDGGQTCQSWTIDVTFVDSDGDGLPDSWEISNFGNITAQDQFGDPDGDGMNNLQEFNNVTDPNVYDGPNTPVAMSPECGTVINSAQTTLTVDNATDPQGTALHYQFELYSDVGLTILVASEDNIAEGTGGQTSWQVPVNLVENTTYYWRARATDQFTYGAYSTVCDFSVDTVNEPPGVPRINSPAFGAQVGSLTPDLTVDNAIDPDPRNVLTYTFEVYSDQALSTLVASQTGVAEGTAGTTTWTTTTTLTEDTFYYWRVRATDDSGLSGDWSTTGQFFVTTVNAPPEAPILVSPQDGTRMPELRPDLVILNADDADFDPLVYDWQLATDETFATIIDSGDNVPPQGLSNTAFTLAADLTEDTHYCWRARSDDGSAQSAYATACFLVSVQNDAPSVPTLQNPSDTSDVDNANPTFSWMPSTDPEGETVTYDIEVMSSSGDVVASASAVGGLVSAVDSALVDGETYTWHARAVDAQGLASDFSDPNEFTIRLGATNPSVVVNGGGCSTTGGDSTGGALLLTGLGLAFVVRRRRR